MNTYKFEDIPIGLQQKFSVKITPDMLENFYKITGDNNPLHMEEDYAIDNGFKNRVVYGMLTASFYSTLAGVYLPGKYCILQEVNTSFYKPVYVDDTLTIIGTVKEKNETLQRVTISAKIVNQEQKRISKAKVVVGFHGK